MLPALNVGFDYIIHNIGVIVHEKVRKQFTRKIDKSLIKIHIVRKPSHKRWNVRGRR